MSDLSYGLIDLLLLVCKVVLHTIIVKHLLLLKDVCYVFKFGYLCDLILKALLLTLQVKNTLVQLCSRIVECLTQSRSVGRKGRLRLGMAKGLIGKGVKVFSLLLESVFNCVFYRPGIPLKSVVRVFLPFSTLT